MVPKVNSQNNLWKEGKGCPCVYYIRIQDIKSLAFLRDPSLQIKLGCPLRLLGVAVEEDWGDHQTSIPVCLPRPFPSSLAHSAVPIPAQHSPGKGEDDWMKGLTRSPTIYFLRSSCQVWGDS